MEEGDVRLPPGIRLFISAAALTAASAIFPGGAAAQPPPNPSQEKPKNLQVLSADMERPAVIEIMRGFALALGVRCEHCHAESGNPPPNDTDFASDAKETKKVARAMLKMTRAINDSLLAETGRSASTRLQVSCFTCHHGVEKPQTLAMVVNQAAREGGAEAAVARYRELRKTYYGRAAYDFGEGSLVAAANELVRRDRNVEAGLRLLQLNLEFFPQSAQTHAAMGDALLAKGDRAAALASYERVLAIQPDNRRLREAVDKLRNEIGAPPRP
jgi:hypothetical protein